MAFISTKYSLTHAMPVCAKDTELKKKWKRLQQFSPLKLPGNFMSPLAQTTVHDAR